MDWWIWLGGLAILFAVSFWIGGAMAAGRLDWWNWKRP